MQDSVQNLFNMIFEISTTITGIAGSSSQTALMLAAERGQWDIVEILIEHGANMNAKGENMFATDFES